MARRLSVAARRAEIVETAQRLIAAKGYRELTLREVARECGMSAPGFMHHFSSLEELLVAVLEHRDAVDVDAITGGSVAERSLSQVLESTVAYYSARPNDQQRFDALEAEAVADPSHPAHEWFLARNERILAAIRPVLEREFADPDTASRMLRYVIDGMRLNRLRAPRATDFETDARAVYALLTRGLEPST
jgi:AcrR family transcriptional regulator